MTTVHEPGRVLIVDDEPGMLRAAERVLSALHTVATAGSPHEALRVAPDFRPDIVVCDIRMPLMDGFELVDALRERLPEIDVIFMTGSHSDPDAHLVRAMRQRAFFFIEKPFDRQVLETLVDRCLELRRLRQAERRHTRRLEQELDEARAFQQSMLGPELLCAGGVEVAARCRPSGRLGGDLVDSMPAGDGAAFVIADVRGHGASAAMLTALVKSAFRAVPDGRFDPVRVSLSLRDSLQPFGAERFVTLVCGLITERGVSYVNAGHPPPVIAGPRITGELSPTAPLVSTMFEPAEYRAAFHPLAPGERVLLFTDGLQESVRLKNAPFRALLETVVAEAPGGAPSLVAALWQRFETQASAAKDDVSVMAAALRTLP